MSNYKENCIFIQFYNHKEMVHPVINGLLNTIDKDNNLIVAIDNLSSNSKDIRNLLRGCYEEDKIDKCYFMDDNYLFNAMREVIKDTLSTTTLKYVTISDGDVIPPKLDKCWTSKFIEYFDKFNSLGGIGFSTDIHHQSKEELKKNAYSFKRVSRQSIRGSIEGRVPYCKNGKIHFHNYINKIDEDVIESLPMFQYYMVNEEVIQSYLKKHPKKAVGDGHISRFMLKNNYKIFRYQSTPAKNMTYDSDNLKKAGHLNYKKNRKDIVSTFHDYKKVRSWETLG